MVSFWPFKGDSTSAASFEKVLSQLSQKITKASAQTDRLRQHQRRYKVLWTLYSSFAYILVVLILVLVTGWQKWNAAEYSAVAGSPLVIYAVRTSLDAYYNYRLANAQNHLQDLVKQREVAIEKLKVATKYDSTQEMLEKYGGTPPSAKTQAKPKVQKEMKEMGDGSKSRVSMGGRTGFAPPPTANIPGRAPPRSPVTPESAVRSNVAGSLNPSPPSRPAGPTEEFAPNAFTAPLRPAAFRQPSTTQYATEGPKWYDRILDIVLGEDETHSKNRIALICQSCRLVNGQAPPGTLTLEEVGRWRCSACQAWNGVEREEKRIMKQVAAEPGSSGSPVGSTSATKDAEPVHERSEIVDNTGGGIVVPDMVEDEDAAADDSDPAVEEALDDTPPASSTRSKARQRKKA